MYVAPTEPAQLKVLGESNVLPETFGVDFLFVSDGKFYGVQRKEYSDFVGSVYDGRLAKELGQMKQISGAAMLLIEGVPKFTLEGQWINGRGQAQSWSINAHHSYLWSVQAGGVWVDVSESLDDTLEVIRQFQQWANKPKHRSTSQRPNPSGAWGAASNREWLNHFLQGLPGVGSETANQIINVLGSPIAWTVTSKELMTVPGIGKKTAERLIRALEYGGTSG